MCKKIKMSRVVVSVFLIFTFSFTAFAQKNSVESQKSFSKEDAEKFYQLTKMAPKALEMGETEKAKSYAELLLKNAENFQGNWNFGNAVHVANLVLGLIALDENKMDEAKNFLLEAGKTPGSPPLNSFGPNMLLAKELLEKEEFETVSQYLELVGVFWKNHDDDLAAWKEAVKNKQIPNFGPNLIYGLEDLYKVRAKKKIEN